MGSREATYGLTAGSTKIWVDKSAVGSCSSRVLWDLEWKLPRVLWGLGLEKGLPRVLWDLGLRGFSRVLWDLEYQGCCGALMVKELA
jgi:hypothetical protein